MLSYFFQKITLLFFSLFVVATATFLFMHALPGDPFMGEQPLPQEISQALRKFYGLDAPLWSQYKTYLARLLRGDLGPSILFPGRGVNQLIQEGFWVSARLGIQALCLALPLGILLGIWGALKRNTWQEPFVLVLTTLGIATPNFVAASLLQWLFGVHWAILPLARWGSFAHTLLPSFSLALLPMAFIARLTRSNLIEAMGQDYIRTARAKGLSLFSSALKHGLRNALLPVLAYLGPLASQILTGSFMVEKIFAIPGLGQWLIQSIGARDYPMILGLTLFLSFFVMVAVFFVDLLYALVDPRIRLSEPKVLRET